METAIRNIFMRWLHREGAMRSNVQVSVSSAATWKPPQIDSIHKLNVAIFQSNNFALVGFGLIIRNNKGEVLAASCDRVEKSLNPLCTAAFVMRKALLFCQSTSFSQVEVECNFAKLVNFINSDRICSLEAAWISEDISLISDSFDFISFTNIPLRCNCAALALSSATKEKDEVIVWLKECSFSLFLIIQRDLH